MMNKKGNASRIILWCLFFIIIGFLIYSLVLTYKEIKKKNPSNENVTTAMVDIAPRFAYNNQFEYSAADYLEKAYLNFYTSPDIVFGYINGGFVTTLDGINTTFYGSSTYCTVINDTNYQNASATPYYFNLSTATSDNVVNLDGVLSSLYLQASNYKVDVAGNIYNYFGHVAGSSTYWSSACVIIECNIPLNLFEGSLSGKFNAGSESWLVGDDNNIYRLSNFGNSIHYANLPSGLVANCSYIKKIILPVWQSANSSGLGYYLLSSNRNYNYSDIINMNNFWLSLTFDVFTQDSNYQSGYDAGYSDGVQAADAALRSYNTELLDNINNLNGEVSSLNSRITQQQTIIAQLQSQLDNNNNFRSLFFTMADVPFRTVSNALGFEFWGVNLFQFFIGIITALGIVWLIKKIL